MGERLDLLKFTMDLRIGSETSFKVEVVIGALVYERFALLHRNE